MHTQAFIEEMKTRLEAEKQALSAENIDDAPDYGRNEEDNATEVADSEALIAASSTAKLRLEEIEAALERISTNTYGVTGNGVLIPEDRLRANPAAITVITR